MGDKDKKIRENKLDNQNWQDEYFFKPRGIGFTEPNIVPLDDAMMSAYNIAKSTYQIYPEVFNMDYLEKETKMKREEISKRMKALYDKRLLMFVMNPATQVYGYGLYYWTVKLKEGTDPSKKKNLSDWFQKKDDICTGFECEGDFDFFNGNHMRVLDNLLSDVIEPWKHNPEIDHVHLCPIRRDLRESHVNMFDSPKDGYREHVWSDDQLEKLVKHQDLMDKNDLRLLMALNKKRPMDEFFDYEKLAELSGLDAQTMRKDTRELVENRRLIVPVFHLDFSKLKLNNRIFVIRTFQNLPSYRKAEIADELSLIEDFNMVMEFSDSYYDIVVAAYDEITDLDRLRGILNSYGEIEEILEADAHKQYRRWVCRLDDENDFWEECVFTDDFLEMRTQNRLCKFNLDGKEEK